MSKFNEKKYLDANPDVREAISQGKFLNGLDHYKKFGIKENRNFVKKLSRFDKVFAKLDKAGLGIEIGPSHNPIAPKKLGFNVHILDHACAEDLKKKYKNHGVQIENIEEVDYIWKGEPFESLVGKKNHYDWIIASHVIEHIPDTISFLKHCDSILKNDGKLSLVIPDKRFCFDYFLPLSSTGNIIDAFENKNIRPSSGQIFDAFANSVKKGNEIAWSKDFVGLPDTLIHNFSDAKRNIQEHKNNSEYVDVHCWRFVPSSFCLIISDLFNLNLTNFEIIQFYETEGCEFYVTLAKRKKIKKSFHNDRLSQLINIDREFNW